MFARYFVELPIDFHEADGRLTRSPEAWLPGLARVAEKRGEHLLAEVGFGDDRRIVKDVAIGFGAPMRMPAKTILPMQWAAARPRGLFPELDADLEIAPLGAHQTQLSMSAQYAPPLGAVGRMIDRAVLHRVAEATLKDFLDRVAQAMLAAAPNDRELAG